LKKKTKKNNSSAFGGTMKHGKMSELERMFSAGQEKEGGPMSEQHRQVKMDMLKELMDHARKGMGDKVLGGLEGMKKVTVASPSSEGLEAGLEKAKELLESKESPLEELSESPSEEMEEESSDPSPAEASEEKPKEEEDEEDYSPFMKRKKK